MGEEGKGWKLNKVSVVQKGCDIMYSCAYPHIYPICLVAKIYSTFAT